MTATATEHVVALAGGHAGPGCLQMAGRLHAQLRNGYTRGVSLLELDTVDGWLAEHRTARKRALRADRLGYRVELVDRAEHAEAIYRVNTSAPARQGRPMSAGYQERPTYGPNPLRCELHHVYTYGALRGGDLTAYLWLYRSGQLALVSSILGDVEHLESGVMYLLIREAIRAQAPLSGALVYNLHDSGTDGLRWFKERCGFRPAEVRWAL